MYIKCVKLIRDPENLESYDLISTCSVGDNEYKLGVLKELNNDYELKLCFNGYHYYNNVFQFLFRGIYVYQYDDLIVPAVFECEIDDNNKIEDKSISCTKSIKLIRSLNEYDIIKEVHKTYPKYPESIIRSQCMFGRKYYDNITDEQLSEFINFLDTIPDDDILKMEKYFISKDITEEIINNSNINILEKISYNKNLSKEVLYSLYRAVRDDIDNNGMILLNIVYKENCPSRLIKLINSLVTELYRNATVSKYTYAYYYNITLSATNILDRRRILRLGKKCAPRILINQLALRRMTKYETNVRKNHRRKNNKYSR